MLTSFETKSARVKGLCFHNNRPILLISLYNGVIQLWDYRMCSLLERFDEHDGPVRAIHFHNSQPIFVSGGDDYKIKIWDFYNRKCTFTLTGHLDYIRSTFFHNEYPWIISCSDDQTIKIWNWQSRKCICTIAGHNHYVMCAQFHPKEPLIVSCSLDQTIRVWDIAGLKRKYYNPSGNKNLIPNESLNQKSTSIDLFVPTDAVVKYVIEGHDRGINYVNFHPTQPLIISCADDRQIKIWRYIDNKAWEIDTCRGHYNNVSVAIFYPHSDLIISVSEDKTIRVWDSNKKTILNTFRRENDRFWALSVHPNQKIIAAGHDNGVIVFKLERERPPYTLHEKSIYYIKDNYIRHFDINSSSDVPIVQLKKTKLSPVNLQYNPSEHSFLINYGNKSIGVESFVTEYHHITSNKQSNDVANSESVRYNSIQGIWIARNKFALLEKVNMLSIKTTNSKDEIKAFEIPNSENLFISGIGTVILKNNDGLSIYDVQLKSVLCSIKIAHIKYIFWSPNNKTIAVISKNCITIVNKNLEILFSVNELLRIKSGVWDETGKIFLYNSSSHIKYIIVETGDKGIVRTLDVLIYMISFTNNAVYCLDRSWKPCIFQLDQTEFRFKLALVERRYDEIIQIVKNSNLVGQSLIGFLRQKQYPEVALHFVQDKELRFVLSTECCNLEEALKVAFELNDKICWEKLSTLATSLGNFKIAETCLFKLKAYDRLLMLYSITGSFDKLQKLYKIVEQEKNDSVLIRILLMTYNVKGLVKFLRKRRFGYLAYETAQVYSLEEESEMIVKECDLNIQKSLSVKNGEKFLTRSPLPFLTLGDLWPRLNVTKNLFDMSVKSDISKIVVHENSNAIGIWADDIDSFNVHSNDEEEFHSETEGILNRDSKQDQNGWDVYEDLDIKVDVNIKQFESSSDIISDGPSFKHLVHGFSNLPADLIAVGNFESAFKILRETVGVVKIQPFEKLFINIFRKSSCFVPTMHGFPFIQTYLPRNIKQINSVSKSKIFLPAVVYSLSSLTSLLKQSMLETTEGKFSEAILLLQQLILLCTLSIVESRTEHNEIIRIISLAKEYIIGLKMELLRRQLTKSTEYNDQKRACELAAYFTHCELQPVHTILALRTLMNLSYKSKNYKLALSSANRLLEMGPSSDVAQQARKVIQSLDNPEYNPISNAFKDLLYDEINPFVICAHNYKPIYKGNPVETCPLCFSSYDPSLKSLICSVCEVSVIGDVASGLRTILSLNR